MSKKNTLFAEEIRLTALEIFEARGFGHVGGNMSVIEALAVLYGGLMNVRPDTPDWHERDRLVMSKGHAGPALYAALYARGYFPKDWLYTLNRPGTRLPSHCDMRKTTGVDMTTGSLGQGMSTAIGMALGQRMDNLSARTFLFVGDGECDEGQIWEGLLLAAHQKLHNLIVFCDKNGQQLDGWTRDVLDLGDLADKFRAFGFFVQTVNGHSTDEIETALEAALAQTEAPSMIVLETVKGYGCTFTENTEQNHHVVIDGKAMEEAIAVVQKRIDTLRAEM